MGIFTYCISFTGIYYRIDLFFLLSLDSGCLKKIRDRFHHDNFMYNPFENPLTVHIPGAANDDLPEPVILETFQFVLYNVVTRHYDKAASTQTRPFRIGKGASGEDAKLTGNDVDSLVKKLTTTALCVFHVLKVITVNY